MIVFNGEFTASSKAEPRDLFSMSALPEMVKTSKPPPLTGRMLGAIALVVVVNQLETSSN